MRTIRCPKCRLINLETAKRCRRCKTVLSRGSAEQASTEPLSWHHAAGARIAAILGVAIVLLLGGYAGYRVYKRNLNSPSGSDSRGVAANAGATDPGLKELIKISEELKSQLERNLAEKKDDLLTRNQAAVFDALALIGDLEKRYSAPTFQKYSTDLSLLLRKYYDLIMQYNTETARFEAAKERINNEIESAKKDSSLPASAKAKKQGQLRTELAAEYRDLRVSPKDLDSALQSIRSYSIPDAPK